MSDAFYTKTWFWLLTLTTIALIVVAILFEYYGATIDQVNGIPFWVWLGFAVAILAYLVSVVLYIIDIRKVTIINTANGNTVNTLNTLNTVNTVKPVERQTTFVGSDGQVIARGVK